MRKAECDWSKDAAAELLRSVEVVHLASTTKEGTPVLRALHAVHVGNLVAFHGARAGESTLCLGQTAVVSAERIVASIPSYFIDPERACPATTYYQSVQASGTLVEVTDIDEKTEIVEALMQKYQEEGGYTALDATSPLYAKALKGLLVYAIQIEHLQGKYQLGQRRNKPEIHKILHGLWGRGGDRDVCAIDEISSASSVQVVDFLQGPSDTLLRCQMGKNEVNEVVDLLRGTYWNQNVDDASIAAAHRNSSAWVGCTDSSGRVLGTARAVSDGIKFAWVLNVIVLDSEHKRGVGQAMMTLLLDHPALRNCQSIGLVTRDAQEFYQRFGFSIVGVHAATGFHQMELRR